MWKNILVRSFVGFAVVVGASAVSMAAPQQKPAPAPGGKSGTPPAPAASMTPPPDYVIGPDDVLTIVFWRNKDESGDFTVRPDGKITIPLINELQASGLTPDQLQKNIVEARRKFEDDPTVYLNVRQINSRKVFITGQVAKPGPYPLLEPTTVLQLISKAGGLTEFADKKHIMVIRAAVAGAPPASFTVNYNDFWDKKKMQKNTILLMPGDTVIIK